MDEQTTLQTASPAPDSTSASAGQETQAKSGGEVKQQASKPIDIDSVKSELLKELRGDIEQERRKVQSQYDRKLKEAEERAQQTVDGIRQAMVEALREHVSEEDLPKVAQKITERERSMRVDAWERDQQALQQARQLEQMALDGISRLGLSRSDFSDSEWGGMPVDQFLIQVAMPKAMAKKEEQIAKSLQAKAKKEFQEEIKQVEKQADNGTLATEVVGASGSQSKEAKVNRLSQLNSTKKRLSREEQAERERLVADLSK